MLKLYVCFLLVAKFVFSSDNMSDNIGLLNFSQSLNRAYISPPVRIQTGMFNVFEATSYETERESYLKIRQNIYPKNDLNKKLLGLAIPKKEMVQLKQILELPKFSGSDNFSFNIIDELNQANLKLSKDYFKEILYIENTLIQDTALSSQGLNQFMYYYGKLRNTETKVFSSKEEAIGYIENHEIVFPSMWLMTLDSSKRHVTGIYFKDGIAHVFDSVGLTFPAFPCAHRYANTDLPIGYILESLQKKEIKISVMPINTAMAIQNDKFSCLSFTIMFFESMINGNFIYLDDPRIIYSFGNAAIYKMPDTSNFTLIIQNTYVEPCDFFNLTDKIFLSSIQNTLTFLYVIDDLNIDLKEVIKLRSDWTLLDNKNIFSQKLYVELLKWFDRNESEEPNLAFPNFEELINQSPIANNRNKSPFEITFDEIVR